MISRSILLMFLGGILLSAPAVAQGPAAQPPGPGARGPGQKVTDERFARLRDRTIEIQEEKFRKVQANIKAQDGEARRLDPFPSAALQAPALNRASAVTSVEMATAAIRTSVEGADAGVSVAPLALAGKDRFPVQFNLTLAALAEQKTQFGASVFYQTSWNPTKPEDIDLDNCGYTGVRDDHLRTINSVRFAVEAGCEFVDAVLAEKLDDNQNIRQELDDRSRIGGAARRAQGICYAPGPCDLSRPESDACQSLGFLSSNIEEVATGIKELYEKSGNGPAMPPWLDRLGRTRDAIKVRISELVEYRKAEPKPDCYSVEELETAAIRASWIKVRHRIGIGFTTDRYPLVYGFNPDADKSLARGELSKYTIRGEYGYVSGPLEFHLGFGVGESRADLEASRYTFISPSGSISAVVTGLSGQGLSTTSSEPHRKNDNNGNPRKTLNLVNKAPPPRLSLGLEAVLDIGLSKPDSQETRFQSVSLTAYADFKFNDKLGFRLGVPLVGKLAKRKADEAKGITESSDLQWTLPLFATTVLKI